MFLKILVLAILFTGCFADGTDEVEKDSQQCNELNDHFAKVNAIFVRCVLDNNEHALFCEDCISEYAATLAIFNELMTANETRDGTPCRSRFVDINQLDLLETIFGYSKRLWEIGDCSGEILFKFYD